MNSGIGMDPILYLLGQNRMSQIICLRLNGWTKTEQIRLYLEINGHN
jgi:hypothetical protein